MHEHIEPPAVVTKKRSKSGGLLLLAGLAVVFAGYHHTIASLVIPWTAPDSSQNHGLLLFAVCFYLLVREWRSSRPSARPSWVAQALTVFFALLWLAAMLVAVVAVEQAALFLVLASVQGGIFGLRQTQFRYLVPTLLPITALPLLDVLRSPLKYAAATGVALLLRATGFTFLQDRNILVMPRGTLEVSDYCSGLAYQVAAVTIAVLMAYSARLGRNAALLLLLKSWFLAFAANVIRIYIVAVVGQSKGMDHPLIGDHQWLGWVIYAVLVVPVLILPYTRGGRGPAGTGGVAVNAVADGGFPTRRLALLVATAVAAPAFGLALDYRARTYAPPGPSVPAEVSGWTSSGGLEDEWHPHWVAADSQMHRSYIDSVGVPVDLFLFHYRTQSHGREAVAETNVPYEPARWKRLVRQHHIALIAGVATEFEESVVLSPLGSRRLVWVCYLIGGRWHGRAMPAKVAGLFAALRARPSATAVVLGTPSSETGEADRRRLARFANSVLPLLPTSIDNTRRSSAAVDRSTQ